MNEVTLYLPYPPTVNHYYKTIRNARGICVYIDQPGLRYRREVYKRVIASKESLKLDIELFYPQFVDKKLSIKLMVFPPDRRKRDLDNILKCLFDSLQHAQAFADDNAIDKIYMERQEMIINGEVIVKINAI